MDGVDELERGRASYGRRAWADAYDALSLADQAAPLPAEDLELLATSAYMLGRDEEHVSGLERAHRAHLAAGESLPAVRCAFWIAINLILRGEMARASGWLGRAQRILDGERGDSVERGFLLLPTVVEQVEGIGDGESGYATATSMAEIGERYGDPDLVTLGVHWQGLALLCQDRIDQGLRRLDEAMVAITAGECSPIVTGVVYCSVIDGCRKVYALRNAQEWTAALTRWCDQQPGIVAFAGRCLVHRAEIMELQGAWPDALAEARQAEQRFAEGMNQAAAGEAIYRQGEVHRLKGEFTEAESAFKNASRLGSEPQPGLALLRLAQGNGEAAAAALERGLAETTEPFERAGLLPAQVEITLAVGDAAQARNACHELEQIATGSRSAMLGAMAAYGRAALELADGDPQAALISARHAAGVWRELEVPYEAARARAVVGLACRALGDDDGAGLELEAARDVFAHLGAAADLVRLDRLTGRGPAPDDHGLTARELEVLRLTAAGKSNREIAETLVISEHTVARHLQNIFAKLGVSSRTAASAFAFANGLA